MDMFVFILVCLALATQLNESSAEEQPDYTCSNVLLRGPFLQSQIGVIGLVYTKMNFTPGITPVFTFRHGDNLNLYLFFHPPLYQWIIGNDFTAKNVHLFARSGAFHPANVVADWWYSVPGNKFEVSKDISVVCSPDVTADSNCSSVLLQGIFVSDQRWRVGTVYTMTNETQDGRPMFTYGQEGFDRCYLLYKQSLTGWMITDSTTEDRAFLFAWSRAKHPADVKATWWYTTLNGSTEAAKDTEFLCSTEALQENNCSNVLLQGPYIKSQAGAIGVVYSKMMNTTGDGRPIFMLHQNDFDLYLFYNTSVALWIIGEDITMNSVRMYVWSTAIHPINVTTVWKWYSTSTGRFEESKDISAVCSPDLMADSNCSSVLLEGPFINAQRWRVGAVYTKTNKTQDGRPIFAFGEEGFNGFYVAYSQSKSTWMIANVSTAEKVYLFAWSTAKHPVDVKATWWYAASNGSVKAAKETAFVCSTNAMADSNCYSVLLQGPFISDQRRRVGAVYTVLNETSGGRPIFEFGEEGVDRLYVVYHQARNVWMIANSSTAQRVYFFAWSTAHHPIDVKATWWYISNGQVKAARDTSFVCSTETLHISNCSSVLVKGPAFYRGLWNATLYRVTNGRPVFKTVLYKKQPTLYVYYNPEYPAWVIGDLITTNVYALSTARHPADVTSTWFYQARGTFIPSPNTSVICKKENLAESTCNHVRFKGPANDVMRPGLRELYETTTETLFHRPVFISTTGHEKFYLHFDKSTSRWGLSRTINSSDFLYYTYNAVQHPADRKSFWWYNTPRENPIALKNVSTVCTTLDDPTANWCRAFTFQGSFDSVDISLIDILTALYRITAQRFNHRVTFVATIGQDSFYMYTYAKQWFVSRKLDGSEASFYAESDRMYPDDVRVAWKHYGTRITDYRISVVCKKDRFKESNCTTLKFELPSMYSLLTNELKDIMRGVYAQINRTISGKPVYKFQNRTNSQYIYYLEQKNAWVISPKTDGSMLWFWAFSVDSHPADVRAIWWFDKRGKKKSYKDIRLVCERDTTKTSNCTSVTFQGKYNTYLRNKFRKFLGMVYTQTNQTNDGKPMFVYDAGQSITYIFYLKSFTAWIISNTTNVDGTNMYCIAHSTANHPVDVQTDWWYPIIFRYYKHFEVLFDRVGKPVLTCLTEPTERRNCTVVRFGKQDYFRTYTTIRYDMDVARRITGKAIDYKLFLKAGSERLWFQGFTFVQIERNIDGKPVFVLGIEDFQTTLYYNASIRAWTVVFNRTDVVFRAFSNADHPADVRATWWYMLVSGTLNTLLHATAVCHEDIAEPTYSNCTSMVFQSHISRIPSAHIEGLGMLYRQFNRTSDGKPTFKIDTELDKMYLSYSKVFTAWVVINKTDDGHVYAFSSSTEDHPSDVRTGWWYVSEGRPQPISRASFLCTKETFTDSNCTIIGFGKLTALMQERHLIIKPTWSTTGNNTVVFSSVKSVTEKVFGLGLLGATFVQTSWKLNGRPVFHFAVDHIYASMYYDSSITAWSIGVNSTEIAFLAFSNASHPADVRATWWYKDSSETFGSVGPVMVSCQNGK